MNRLIARLSRPLDVPPDWYAIPLRLVVGYGFMEHGYAKLARGPEAFVHILTALGVPMPELAAWATILVELLGGEIQVTSQVGEGSVFSITLPVEIEGRTISTIDSEPPLAELGDNPDNGQAVRVLEGRYGVYVTDGVVNATVPRGTDPAELTLDEAVGLLRARAEAGPKTKKAAKKAAKKPAKKKGGAKKKGKK